MKKTIVYALTVLLGSLALSACSASQLKVNLLQKTGEKVQKLNDKVDDKFQKAQDKIDQKIEDEKKEDDSQLNQDLNASPSSSIDQDLNQIESDLQ